MIATEEVRGIHKVLGNIPAVDKASLIRINEAENVGAEAEAIGEHLGDQLHGVVLQGDGAKSMSRVGPILLGEEDKEGSIQAVEIGGTSLEGSSEIEEIVLGIIPEGSEEGRAKAICLGARINVHGKQSSREFIEGEGGADSFFIYTEI